MSPVISPSASIRITSLFWGVNSLNAKAVESGELIKFSFRVIDGEKAKSLNDNTIQSFLYDPAIPAQLVISSLEKVGHVRQAQTPEDGKICRMAFSNPGRVVKRGDLFTVVIGNLHMEGLSVQ